MRTATCFLAFTLALVACDEAAAADHADGGAPAPCSACDDLAAVAFDQPQIGDCLVNGAGFLVDGPAVPDSYNPAVTWVSGVQGRPNPTYPDLVEDGVIVRRGLLGDCEWLACVAKR